MTTAAAADIIQLENDRELSIWQDGYQRGRTAIEGVPYAGFPCWDRQRNVGYPSHEMMDGHDERIPGAGADSIDAPSAQGYEFCTRCGIREYADGTVEFPNGTVVQV